MVVNGCMSLDLEITYKGVQYRIIEKLASETLLVIKKDDFDNNRFPVETYVIPDEFLNNSQ